MIELQDVSYGYGDSMLLTGISLKLAPGSFHFLTGPSGAGKTTLIKLCYGELVASAGAVGLFGRDVAAMSRDDIALARAVIMSPEVVLADEPTGNIDWEMSLRLLTLLVELNRMGKTILIATHDMNLIRQAKSQVAVRVLRIAGGQLHLAGADL